MEQVLEQILGRRKGPLAQKILNNRFSIAPKEADETKYWLEILSATGREAPKEMINNCEELIKILVSIIKNP